MKKQVHTKFHDFLEVAKIVKKGGGRDAELIDLFLTDIDTKEHYIFDDGVFEALDKDKEKYYSTFQVLAQFGKLKLPHPEILVELKDGNDGRAFFRLAQAGNTFQMMAFFLYRLHDRFELTNGIMCVFELETEADRSSDRLWRVEYDVGAFKADIDDATLDGTFSLFNEALKASLLISNLQGLEREIIEPSQKFNKQRKMAGKSLIKRHSLIKIGHSYDRDGNKLKYFPKKKIALHMRAAHTRRQPHGSAWIKANQEEATRPYNTKDYHLVFIPPTLVNFEEGSEIPTPKPKVIKW